MWSAAKVPEQHKNSRTPETKGSGLHWAMSKVPPRKFLSLSAQAAKLPEFLNVN
jgi:hypothetical protein